VRQAKLKTLGADDDSTLTTLSNLGATYWLAGRAPEAIALLEKVRDVELKRYGADDPRTLVTLQNLGGVYLEVKRHGEGTALLEKVLASLEKQYGPAHPKTLNAMALLASAYRGDYKMRRARDLFRKARDLAVLNLGQLHPLTVSLLDGLAQMHTAYGEHAVAIALGEQVCERQTMIRGPHHPSTLLSLHHLGLAYQADKKLDKALPLFQQAAAGIEKLDFLTGHAEQVIPALYGCQERLKRHGEAEAWRRKWLAVIKEKRGPESEAYAEGLTGLGSNLLRQEKYAEAVPFLREGLAVLQKKQPDKWGTARAEGSLGAALLGLKRYAEAEPHLLRACQRLGGWYQRLGPGHASSTKEPLTEALERLVRLHDAQGKPQEAAKWRKELEGLSDPPG
jgi:tetratricopeptide (TPR) repeat protein